VASSIAALSRTDRVSTCSTVAPRQSWPRSGPVGVRPRVGLRPNSPQHDAGILIEPPPSPPPAIGTMPAAIAAADPPLEPPGVRDSSQGFRHGPHSFDSVTGRRPHSGRFVLPKIETPVARTRVTNSESFAMTCAAR
jgi:hypothetical protein